MMRGVPVSRSKFRTIVLIALCSGGSTALCGCNAPDEHPRYHALMWAISRDDLAAVRAQIKGGTNSNDFPPQNADEDDIAPLCAATRGRSLKMVSLLLDCGAKIDVWDGWGDSPLEVASGQDDLPMMNLLLSRGATVNDEPTTSPVREKPESSALWRAATSNQRRAVSLLLAHGANPNARMDTPQTSKTLLTIVTEWHYTEVARLLQKAGAK